MPKDQLSDFISRWNNRRRSSLTLLNSKKIKRIVSLLKEENYIDFKVVDETVKNLNLIITKDHIKCLKQMSKQSRYVYKSYNDLLTDSKLKQNQYLSLSRSSILHMIHGDGPICSTRIHSNTSAISSYFVLSLYWYMYWRALYCLPCRAAA